MQLFPEILMDQAHNQPSSNDKAEAHRAADPVIERAAEEAVPSDPDEIIRLLDVELEAEREETARVIAEIDKKRSGFFGRLFGRIAI